jgi:hypothetical protein
MRSLMDNNILRQNLHQFIQNITNANSVEGGNRHDVVHSQPVKLRCFQFPASSLGLVGYHKNRFFGPAKDVGHLFVGRGQTISGIEDEQDDISLLDGHQGLLPDEGEQAVLHAGVQTARVNESELFIPP